MRKIKIFSDDGAGIVERSVNDWLRNHPSIIIHHVLQSESYLSADNDEQSGMWSLTITIFYYEGEA